MGNKENDKNEIIDKITFKDFINYLENHLLLVVITTIIIILTHGYLFFNNNIGVDTDIFITNPETNYNWLENGRYGLVVEKYLLNLSSFNIFFAEVMFILLLIVFCVVAYYTYYKISGKDFKLLNLCIPLIFLTSPIFAEQFVFLLQSAEIALSLLLTILAILCVYKYIIDKKIIYAAINVILLIIVLGSYQSFFTIYIAFCLFGFILLCGSMEYNLNNKNFWICILKLLATFVIAFIGYEIIIKILNSNFDYLNNANYWAIGSKKECLKNIYRGFKEMLKGKGNYYNIGLPIGIISMLIIGIYNAIKNKTLNIPNKIVYFAVYGLFAITPLSMTIYLGNNPPMRSQFYIPLIESLAIGFLLYYLCNIDKIKLLKVLSFIIVIIIFLYQAHITSGLYYGDYLTRQNDIQVAYKLIYDMTKYGINENDKVYFYGHLNEKINSSALTGEIIGTSAFEMGHTQEPLYYHSSKCIIRLLKSLGYNYEIIPEEKVTEARIHAGELQETWPKENCIFKADDYYVVKIAEF